MGQDVLQPGGPTTVTVAGVVSVTAAQSGAWAVSIVGTPSVDVSDRAGRLLGHVTVDSLPAAVVSGSVIATPSTDDTATLLRLILRELAVTNLLLQAGLNIRDELDALRADPVLAALVG